MALFLYNVEKPKTRPKCGYVKNAQKNRLQIVHFVIFHKKLSEIFFISVDIAL